MKKAQHIVEQLFTSAGITINGSAPWDIQIHDDRLFGRVLRDRNMGLGEAYMDGWWDCRQVDTLICRILSSNIREKVKEHLLYLIRLWPWYLLNLHTRRRSRKSIAHHYDLGNDLFFSLLDPYNQYSCGYFTDTDGLFAAQQNKLELICRKMNLMPKESVLDIGCGWGGLAKYAAQRIGCSVTAVNISHEQLNHARQVCKGLPVEFKDCDYREISGCFDKIVSVGMFEHVGVKNYPTFMNVVHRSLKDDGIFLLHTIGGNRSENSNDPWMTKYIFPDSMLPSPAQITKATEGLFIIEDWHNLGPHYDKTLIAWNDRFQKAWKRLKKKYDTRFKRMWEYYLLSCAGSFRARNIQVWQIVMTKADTATAQPECRPEVALWQEEPREEMAAVLAQ